MSKARYAEILTKIGAISIDPDFGFTWASGIRSPIYCDNRLLLSFPEEREIIVNGLVDLLQQNFPEAQVLAGTATAGIPHAAFMAQKLNMPMLYVRSSAKEHGKGNQIEGKLTAEQKIVVIEDLISTGKSSMQAVQALREAGANVIGLISIFTYGLQKSKDLFSQEDLSVKSLLSMPEMLELSSMPAADKEKIQDFLQGL
mgnify:CR=1 FL=1|tara:strand:+ start:14710 stop:15309 length:600 start_codon:yes stop_codon:yes gene_type:complete